MADCVRADVLVDLGIREKPINDHTGYGGLAQLVAAKQKAAAGSGKGEAKADGKAEQAAATTRKSPLALIIDTTTDVATIEQLLVYARAIKDGEAITKYLGIIPVPNGKSDTIYQAVVDFAEDIGIDLSVLAGFGSDGAKSMVGEKKGVATQLRKLSGFMLAIHCAGHRGNLAGEARSYPLDISSLTCAQARALQTKWTICSASSRPRCSSSSSILAIPLVLRLYWRRLKWTSK